MSSSKSRSKSNVGAVVGAVVVRTRRYVMTRSCGISRSSNTRRSLHLSLYIAVRRGEHLAEAGAGGGGGTGAQEGGGGARVWVGDGVKIEEGVRAGTHKDHS